ncbi:MAG: iron export ABC transporter permease subunit FetB [Fidelibacterota bacterium]
MKDTGFYLITWTDVLASLVFIVVCVVLIRWRRVGLEKTLLVGTLRTFIQLSAMGFLLNYIFELNNWPFMVLLLLLMIVIAAGEGVRRQKEVPIPGYFLILAGALIITLVATLGSILSFILEVQPWYYPWAMIPIGGMIIGNGLNSATLAVNRFTGELTHRKREIEMFLSLGASPRVATQESVRAAVKAALIPTINALMMVGLVQLPGVMTGQILAGADPLVAVRYQIMIMYMWVTVSVLTVLLTLALVARRFFTRQAQLKQEMLRPVKG